MVKAGQELIRVGEQFGFGAALNIADPGVAGLEGVGKATQRLLVKVQEHAAVRVRAAGGIGVGEIVEEVEADGEGRVGGRVGPHVLVLRRLQQVQQQTYGLRVLLELDDGRRHAGVRMGQMEAVEVREMHRERMRQQIPRVLVEFGQQSALEGGREAVGRNHDVVAGG